MPAAGASVGGGGALVASLEARRIVKHFSHGGYRLRALDGIDLRVDDGEFVCIVGPSGCGKSTLLRIVAGLDEPDSGEILLNGKPVSGTGPERIMVFQEGALFPWLTVSDNVEFGLKMAGIPRGERSEISARYLDMMQLSDFADSYTYQLSTGMKQRVAIARALAIEPEAMICDEPTSALDVSVQAQILNLLRELRARLGLTYVFISHDLAVVEHIADRVAVMYLGRLVELGPAASIFDRPRHPYTRALLESALTPDPHLGLPAPGLGAGFPDPLDPPPGCRFHPRCPAALAGCAVAEPVAIRDQTGIIACHLFDGGGPGRPQAADGEEHDG